MRGVYLLMEPLAWLVLVPLAFASLLTGLVQSLGSAGAWVLVRHYWVLFKLLITVVALAQRAPERIDGLVLVSPPVFRDSARARERLARRDWLSGQAVKDSVKAPSARSTYAHHRPSARSCRRARR